MYSKREKKYPQKCISERNSKVFCSLNFLKHGVITLFLYITHNASALFTQKNSASGIQTLLNLLCGETDAAAL